MSSTQCLLPICAAVDGAERYLGGNRLWATTDSRQSLVLPTPNLRLDTIKEIVTKASRSVEELNAFLREHGFSIELDAFEGPKDFGVVSILNLLVEWFSPGKEVPIMGVDGKTYSGVQLKRSEHGVRFFHHPRWPGPIVQIHTLSGDLVYLSPISESQVPDMATIRSNLPSYDNLARRIDGYSDVQFPMVNLNQEVDISWLKGLNTVDQDNLPAVITQALQQTRFRMNQFGARAESAVAVGVASGFSIPNSFIINSSFAVWITRPGIEIPLFFGYITPEDWKDPGSLR